MSEQFTIHRAAEGPGWPFGAGAVAAGSALLGGIIALAIPMAALDWIAFQLYLDQIVGIIPPLGLKAKLAVVLLLALLFGVIGYAVARRAGVRSTGGFADLLARLRGVRVDDEEDAPRLRGSDRHPDAPARRPLSAQRDLDARRARDPDHDAAGSAAAHFGLDDDDDDELLLIAPMAAEVPNRDPAPLTPPALMPMPTQVLPVADPAPAPVAMDFADAVDWPDDDDDDFHIPAPHADDWLTAPAPAPMPSASLAELRQADVRLPLADYPPVAAESAPAMVDPVVPAPIASATPAPAPPTLTPAPPFAAEFTRMRAAPPPPLDLSVARLDELIARVEAGMLRRAAAPVAEPLADIAAQTNEAVAPVAPAFTAAPVMADPVVDAADPSFPQDPALAAALATLRRMAAA